MQCGERHIKVNEQGIGFCSVPMWCNGLPAGFCDEQAYGYRENKQVFDRYVPYLACPGHGGPTIRVFMDGDQFCAVKPDFINLQESPVGFGNTKKEAIQALKEEMNNEQRPRKD